jgi:hypothetical protein
MDARLDPAKYAGLSEGDAHVIRNAGGRASDDAIRSSNFAQTFRNSRVVCYSSYGLWYDPSLMKLSVIYSLKVSTSRRKRLEK